MNARIPEGYATWDARFRQYVNEGAVEQALNAWSRMMTYAEPGNRAPSSSALESRDRYMRGAYAISAEKSLTLLNKHYAGRITVEQKHMRADLIARALEDAQASGDTDLLARVEQTAYNPAERFYREAKKSIFARMSTFGEKVQQVSTSVKEKVAKVAAQSWFQKCNYAAHRLFI